MKSNPDHSKKIAQILKFQVNEKKEYRQISIPYESGRLFIQLRELIRCEAYGALYLVLFDWESQIAFFSKLRTI